MPRHLVRVVCRDSPGRRCWVAVICACSSSITSAISFRAPASRDGEPGCGAAGRQRCPGEMAPPAHVSASPPTTPMISTAACPTAVAAAGTSGGQPGSAIAGPPPRFGPFELTAETALPVYNAAYRGSPGGLLAAVLTDRWVSVGLRARGQAVGRARPRPGQRCAGLRVHRDTGSTEHRTRRLVHQLEQLGHAVTWNRATDQRASGPASPWWSPDSHLSVNEYEPAA